MPDTALLTSPSSAERCERVAWNSCASTVCTAPRRNVQPIRILSIFLCIIINFAVCLVIIAAKINIFFQIAKNYAEKRYLCGKNKE
jgi:hypothetical protein